MKHRLLRVDDASLIPFAIEKATGLVARRGVSEQYTLAAGTVRLWRDVNDVVRIWIESGGAGDPLLYFVVTVANANGFVKASDLVGEWETLIGPSMSDAAYFDTDIGDIFGATDLATAVPFKSPDDLHVAMRYTKAGVAKYLIARSTRKDDAAPLSATVCLAVTDYTAGLSGTIFGVGPRFDYWDASSVMRTVVPVSIFTGSSIDLRRVTASHLLAGDTALTLSNTLLLSISPVLSGGGFSLGQSRASGNRWILVCTRGNPLAFASWAPEFIVARETGTARVSTGSSYPVISSPTILVGPIAFSPDGDHYAFPALLSADIFNLSVCTMLTVSDGTVTQIPLASLPALCGLTDLTEFVFPGERILGRFSNDDNVRAIPFYIRGNNGGEIGKLWAGILWNSQVVTAGTGPANSIPSNAVPPWSLLSDDSRCVVAMIPKSTASGLFLRFLVMFDGVIKADIQTTASPVDTSVGDSVFVSGRLTLLKTAVAPGVEVRTYLLERTGAFTFEPTDFNEWQAWEIPVTIASGVVTVPTTFARYRGYVSKWGAAVASSRKILTNDFEAARNSLSLVSEDTSTDFRMV